MISHLSRRQVKDHRLIVEFVVRFQLLLSTFGSVLEQDAEAQIAPYMASPPPLLCECVCLNERLCKALRPAQVGKHYINAVHLNSSMNPYSIMIIIICSSSRERHKSKQYEEVAVWIKVCVDMGGSVSAHYILKCDNCSNHKTYFSWLPAPFNIYNISHNALNLPQKIRWIHIWFDARWCDCHALWIGSPIFILENGTSVKKGTYNGMKIITQTYYGMPVWWLESDWLSQGENG